jgi:hypothetical protein
MTVRPPASRGRGLEDGRTHRAVGKEYTAQMSISQAFFALGMQEHGGRASASGADVEPCAADM